MTDEEWQWLERVRTEEEWRSASSPQPTLNYLGDRASNRKFRLFAVACCRRIWQLLTDMASRRAIEVAERLADGKADDGERAAAEAAADDTVNAIADAAETAEDRGEVAYHATLAAAWSARSFDYGAAEAAGHAAYYVAVAEHTMEPLVVLLHDLFGNPFRPLPPLGPSLLNANGGILRQLAQAAYEERLLPSGHLDPARLAVLADALEEAGGDNELALHLRQQGAVHVRGCAVVDLLLGLS